MSGIATLPLFQLNYKLCREAALTELQGHNLPYVEGYTVGYETALAQLSVETILNALNAMRPQASSEIAIFLFQKLRYYRRYIPSYHELSSKTFKPDILPTTLLPFQPSSKPTDPEFQAGQRAGTTALTTYYERLLEYFRSYYADWPPLESRWEEEGQPTPILPNGDPMPEERLTIKQQVVKYQRERDEQASQIEVALRTSNKATRA
jgi:hypothetical protein